MYNKIRNIGNAYLNPNSEVSPEDQQTRIHICRTLANGYPCPYHKPASYLRAEHCGACGCSLDKKARTIEPGCPLGYWQELGY